MSDIDKIRKEFEVGAVNRARASPSGNHPRLLERYSDGDRNYIMSWVDIAWETWQASRQAVVVELPKPHLEFEGDTAPEMFASQVVAAIEAQGLRVGVRP